MIVAFCGGRKTEELGEKLSKKDEISPLITPGPGFDHGPYCFIRWKASVHTTTPFPLPNMINAKEGTRALIREKWLHLVIGLT